MLNRQGVLQSLNKLSENHTRAKAWEELTYYAERLDSTTLPAFLQCLHNTTAQHTVACRRGAVRMYGHLALLHPELLPPHLARISDCIVARLKEKDATRELREACAGACGALVKELGAEATLPVVLRPLLPLVSDNNEAHQTSCALALGAILPPAGELPEAVAGRIAAPLLRTLAHPAIGAHASLLDAGSIFLTASPVAARASAAPLLSAAFAAASSTEFSTRRASADFLRSVAASHPHILSASAARAYSVLHLLRADKQRVVREAALGALKCVRESIGEGGLPAGAAGAAEGKRPSVSQVRQLLRQQQQQLADGGHDGRSAAPPARARAPPEGFDFSLRVPHGLTPSAITGSASLHMGDTAHMGVEDVEDDGDEGGLEPNGHVADEADVTALPTEAPPSGHHANHANQANRAHSGLSPQRPLGMYDGPAAYEPVPASGRGGPRPAPWSVTDEPTLLEQPLQLPSPGEAPGRFPLPVPCTMYPAPGEAPRRFPLPVHGVGGVDDDADEPYVCHVPPPPPTALRCLVLPCAALCCLVLPCAA